MSKEAALTLGTQEVTLLLTGSDGTVDVVLELIIAQVVDLVVGLDVLLDSLAAVVVWSACALMARKTKHDGTRNATDASWKVTHLDPLRSFNCKMRKTR